MTPTKQTLFRLQRRASGPTTSSASDVWTAMKTPASLDAKLVSGESQLNGSLRRVHLSR